MIASRRGFMNVAEYQTIYQSADELAAIISGLMHAASGPKAKTFREEEATYEPDQL